MHFLEDEGGCTPVRGIFRGKFYDGLFDAASSHNSPTAGRNKSAQYVNYNYRQEYPCNHTRVRLGRLGRRLFICGRMKSRLPPHSPFHSYFCFITLSLAFEGLREEELLHIVPPLFPSPHLRHLSAHFIVVESCAASREMHSFVIGLWPSANSRSPLTL